MVPRALPSLFYTSPPRLPLMGPTILGSGPRRATLATPNPVFSLMCRGAPTCVEERGRQPWERGAKRCHQPCRGDTFKVLSPLRGLGIAGRSGPQGLRPGLPTFVPTGLTKGGSKLKFAIRASLIAPAPASDRAPVKFLTWMRLPLCQCRKLFGVAVRMEQFAAYPRLVA